MTRRGFLAGAAALAAGGCAARLGDAPAGVRVNDVHAGISGTWVSEVAAPADTAALRAAVARGPASVGGGRYCSGGQPFLAGRPLIDTRRLAGVTEIDRDAGLVTARAGTTWPTLIGTLRADAPEWTVRQKQSGTDHVTLGGTLSVNAHGRCLTAPPIVDDVEAITLLGADGVERACDRRREARRFRHAVGGYGMFGVMTDVTLRLVPRAKQVRRVRVVAAGEAVAGLDAAAARGATHGDFQYRVDPSDGRFLTEGLLVTYEPADDGDTVREPASERQRRARFSALAAHAHADRPGAWAAYEAASLAGDGVVDFADGWQMAEYAPGYHEAFDGGGTDVLSEVFVPRGELAAFLEEVAAVFRGRRADLVYGNVRLIEPDGETALPWARGRWACVVFNQHVGRDAGGVALARAVFREVLDRALARGGTYYLAHHRFATPAQVLAAHPALPGVLAEADAGDPAGRLGSDWRAAMRALARGVRAAGHGGERGRA